MPAKTITCPHCGLVLRVSGNDAGTALIYDVTDWQRVDLDNPAASKIRECRASVTTAVTAPHSAITIPPKAEQSS